MRTSLYPVKTRPDSRSIRAWAFMDDAQPESINVINAEMIIFFTCIFFNFYGSHGTHHK
jgi:hypothetical protein